MIGQEKLLEKLFSYSINTFPKASIFIGESGSGRKTIIKELSSHIHLPVIDILQKMSQDSEKNNMSNIESFKATISEAKESCLYKMYFLDMTDATINKEIQTALLKLLEDTPKYMFIALIAESELDVAPAVLNRCVKFNMEIYTQEQLQSFKKFSNELVYKACQTPGKLMTVSENSVKKLYTFANEMSSKLKANKFGALINDVLNLTTENDYKLLFEIIKQVSFEKYRDSNNIDYYNIYLFTCSFLSKLFDKVNKIWIKNVQEENFLINYFSKLGEVVR